MQDRMEIYPYQRVEQASGTRGKKRSAPWNEAVKRANIRQLISQINLGSLRNMVTWENALLGLGALIMSRAFVLGELLPFIFAYSAAFAYKDRNRLLPLALCTLIGFGTVLQGFNLWFNLISLFILMAVLQYIELPDDKAWFGLPFLTIAVLIISKSLLLFTEGMSFYREMNVIFEAMITGILTFVFMVGNDVIRQRKALGSFSFEEMAAFLVLGIGLIMGLNDVHLGGLSLPGILCRLSILVAAFIWGSGAGTMVGVMTGLIPSISSSVFAQTLGMYAVSGLLAGALRSLGRIGVIIGFMLGTLALSMFIAETQTTILVIWETGIACAVFLLLPDSLRQKIAVQTIGPISSLKESEMHLLDRRIKETARSRMEQIATVFDELSSTFTNSSGPARSSDGASLNYLYDEISHGFCQNCSRYKRCWSDESYNTSQEMLDIFTLAETHGSVSYEECPPAFKHRCIYGRELINAVNYLFDNLRLNEYWSEKLFESRDLVAHQLKGVGQVVKDLAEEIDATTVVDFDLRDKLLKALPPLELKIRDITPIRTGEQVQLQITASSCADGQACTDSIAPALSALMGERMEVCEKKCPRIPGKGSCELSLARAFTYKVLSGAAQIARDQICGDSFTLATLAEGKQLAAISDGMGVGQKAASESEAAIKLLENLLSSGFNKETALKTINSVLLLRASAETFATLDMLMIDLYTCEADFIKIGSAPSYVKRGKQVGAINSNSLPIGILDNLEVVSEKVALCPRDIVVMVSDGVLESGRKRAHDNWVKDFLAAVDERDPQVLAEMIINRALSLSRTHPRDDMTVLCMYIDIN
jgi:stage II sporulation protein E